MPNPDAIDPTSRLIPSWPVGKVLSYEIEKSEVFEKDEDDSGTFSRKYTIELKLLDNQIIEAYYPQGLLYATKYFEELEELFPKIINARASCLYYSVNSVFSGVTLENGDELQKNLNELREELLSIIKKEKKNEEDQVEEVNRLFNYFSEEKERIERCFLEDIRKIHEYYGIVLLDGEFIDLKQFEEESTEEPDQRLDALNLKLGSIDLLQFDLMEDGIYKVESIYGHDSITSPVRNDFQEIEDSFLYEEFDVKSYKNIDIHHAEFCYASGSNLLTKMIYQGKKDTTHLKRNTKLTVTLQQ